MTLARQVVERLPEFVLVPEPAAEESDEEEDEEDQDQIFFVSPGEICTASFHFNQTDG